MKRNTPTSIRTYVTPLIKPDAPRQLPEPPEPPEPDDNAGSGFHTRPRPEWDEAKCEKIAAIPRRHGIAPQGLFHQFGTPYPEYGRRKFNGGIIIDGEWYNGIAYPYPKVAEGYVLCVAPSWGVLLATVIRAQREGLTLLRLTEEGFPW